MKLKLVKFVSGIAIAVLLLVLSCAVPPETSGVPTPAPQPSPIPAPTPTPYSTVSIPIEEFPNHPHIDVVMHAVVGEDLTVTLGSNPTTGFRWSEFAEISDETIVQQTSHKYVGKEYEAPPPPGTSGEEVWTFRALKKGATTISMEYSRPWIEEDIGHWTVTITANIKL